MCRQCLALNQRVEFLEEQLANLLSTMGAAWSAPVEYGLTPSQAIMFGALVHTDVCTKERIMQVLYGSRLGDHPGDRIVDVMLTRIRQAVSEFGVEIKTLWGHGLTIPGHQREVLRAYDGGPAPRFQAVH